MIAGLVGGRAVSALTPVTRYPAGVDAQQVEPSGFDPAARGQDLLTLGAVDVLDLQPSAGGLLQVVQAVRPGPRTVATTREPCSRCSSASG